ncbi:MAG: hypothetical protein D6772_04960, partial [Bacteroidetes bacterium]
SGSTQLGTNKKTPASGRLSRMQEQLHTMRKLHDAKIDPKVAEKSGFYAMVVQSLRKEHLA